MRYYKIVISPPSGQGSTGFTPIEYSTLTSVGGNNGSALQVELDLFQTWYHQPAQNGFVRINGVDFKQLQQSANLNPSGTNYCTIQIYVGMSKGLPYANPRQAGLVINGSILQAFGNWQGNQTSLDLIIIPATYVPDTNINLTCNWLKSQNLQQAITQTLNTAYPGVPVNGTISSDLLYTEDQVGQYANLYAFSEYVNEVSKQINPQDNYLGVSIASTSSGFLIYDGTVAVPKLIQVQFQDIIGNLTWIDTFTMQAKLVMRADMEVGTLVQFPTGIPFINVAGSYAQFRDNISFNGQFIINSVRHVGNSRQPDGNSWVTIIECVIPGATQ